MTIPTTKTQMNQNFTENLKCRFKDWSWTIFPYKIDENVPIGVKFFQIIKDFIYSWLI